MNSASKSVFTASPRSASTFQEIHVEPGGARWTMVDSERQRLSFLHSRFGRRRFSCKILGLLLGQLPGTRCTRTPTTPTTPLTRHQLKTSENQVERRRLSTLSKCFLQKHLAKSYSKIIFISFHTDVISDVLNVSDLENALSNCAPHL